MRALARKQRKLAVGPASAKQAGDDFVTAWKRAEKGLPPEEPINRLHFADGTTMFKCLSAERFELLQHVRKRGPLSIRKTAAELHRDYKNVQADVKDLLQVGLIEKTGGGLLSVPWDEIFVTLPLLVEET